MLFLDLISVAPDLRWRRQDFFGFVFKGERNVSYFFLYFCCLPLNKKVRLLQYFNWSTEEVESKKLKWQFSNRKKNCSENPKHHYVAFQLPRNSIKNIASLFFLHDRKNFCSCDEHFSPQKNFNFGWLYLADFLHCEHQQRFSSFLIWTFVLPK